MPTLVTALAMRKAPVAPKLLTVGGKEAASRWRSSTRSTRSFAAERWAGRVQATKSKESQ